MCKTTASQADANTIEDFWAWGYLLALEMNVIDYDFISCSIALRIPTFI